MQEGFVLDFGQGCFFQASWVAGPAQRPRGWGQRPGGEPGRSLAVNPGGAAPIPIDTCRCRECGYLESYARNRSG
jgi:hypothetical protein